MVSGILFDGSIGERGASRWGVLPGGGFAGHSTPGVGQKPEGEAGNGGGATPRSPHVVAYPGWKYGRVPGGVGVEPETEVVDAEAQTRVPLRVLVVDDSRVFVGTLRRLLQTLPGIEIAGVATSGEEAVDLAEQLHPDLVLMDLAMPGMDGLKASEALDKLPARPVIIIMSIHDLPRYRRAARAAGADAFVTKSDLFSQLEPLIRHLLSGARGGDDTSP
jgi:CheY-like chemotaxis protein